MAAAAIGVWALLPDCFNKSAFHVQENYGFTQWNMSGKPPGPCDFKLDRFSRVS
jgi:hypothetical protein